MSFASILRELVDDCGAIGAILMSSDGISDRRVRHRRPLPAGPLSEEFAAVGVEFGRILEEVRKASDRPWAPVPCRRP